MNTRTIDISHPSKVLCDTALPMKTPLPIFLTEGRARRYFTVPNPKLVEGMIHGIDENKRLTIDDLPGYADLNTLYLISRNGPEHCEILGAVMTNDTVPKSNLTIKLNPLGSIAHYQQMLLTDPTLECSVSNGLTARNFNFVEKTVELYGDSLILECMTESDLALTVTLDTDNGITSEFDYVFLGGNALAENVAYDERSNTIVPVKEYFLQPERYSMAVTEAVQSQILDLFDKHQYFKCVRVFTNGVAVKYTLIFESTQGLPHYYHVHQYGSDRTVTVTVNYGALPDYIRKDF